MELCQSSCCQVPPLGTTGTAGSLGLAPSAFHAFLSMYNPLPFPSQARGDTQGPVLPRGGTVLPGAFYRQPSKAQLSWGLVSGPLVSVISQPRCPAPPTAAWDNKPPLFWISSPSYFFALETINPAVPLDVN